MYVTLLPPFKDYYRNPALLMRRHYPRSVLQFSAGHRQRVQQRVSGSENVRHRVRGRVPVQRWVHDERFPPGQVSGYGHICLVVRSGHHVRT